MSIRPIQSYKFSKARRTILPLFHRPSDERVWSRSAGPGEGMSLAGGWSFQSQLNGITPEELFVNLLCADEVLDLLQPRIGPVLENLRRHVNPLEQGVKLLRAAPRIPRTLESRHVFPDFFKGY